EARERADRLGQTEVQGARSRERGERVVRVVEAGDRDADRLEHVADRSGEHELAAAGPERDFGRGDVAGRTRETARRAGPVADVGENDTRVRERRLAARTARRVADRLRDDAPHIRIVDTAEDGLRVA